MEYGISLTRWGAVAALALLLGVGTPVAAQTTTGSIRGVVTGSDGAPVAGASVVARSLETNTQRTAITTETGFYYLGGLRPGPYEVRVEMLGYGAQTRTVRLAIGQTLDLGFTLAPEAVALEAITVVAEPVAETRTSEIAVNVRPEQIESLPTSDRNFLSLAVLAPGTRLHNDRLDGTRKTLSAGAQAPEQINVFIDGASYKNDILQGGVAGQDASRGNPFPRNAVQEFRVITQNFKAEYQKASSAIIVATTKSGTNEWRGSAFYNYQHEGLVALDSFQVAQRDNDPNFSRPDYKRHQFGFDIGGPLIKDRLHMFASYEANRQNRARRVNIVPPSGYPALDTINFAQYNGEFDEPFRATLGLFKLSYQHTENSQFELSYNHRHENDIRDFGGNKAFQAATRFKNDVNTGILKHTYARGPWLNEATVSFQRYRYNPVPNTPGTVNRFYGFGCCAEIGSAWSEQDFTQKRLSFRNDLTRAGLSWAGSHVVKLGFNVDFLDYDIIKRNEETPRFVYEPWHFDFAFPHRVEFQTGDPNFGASNTQVGLYIQDDWSPTDRLVLNLGVRWDFESNMINLDYVTPQAVVDSIRKYKSNLFLPLDESRYFTDGNDRSPFLGAIQPRLGLAYSLGRDRTTTLFGGWGIFYDRTVFDHAIEESFALQRPKYVIQFYPNGGPPEEGKAEWRDEYLTNPDAVRALAQQHAFNTPEVKLLPNDLEPPRAQHFNVGVRQLLDVAGGLVLEAAYTGVREENILTFNWADRDFTCPAPSFATPGCFVERRIPGYATVLLGTTNGKSWYDALNIKVDRPYRRSESGWGWGAGLTYTYAKRQTEGFVDLFAFPNSSYYPKQVRNDEPHRIVGNWIVDIPYLWGMQFSGLLTLGSGTKYDVGTRFDNHDPNFDFEPGGFEPPKGSFILPEAFAYRMVDLRLRKDFLSYRGNRAALTVDLFNAFNFQNYGCYGDFLANRANENFGKPNCVISDPRRLQIGMEFHY